MSTLHSMVVKLLGDTGNFVSTMTGAATQSQTTAGKIDAARLASERHQVALAKTANELQAQTEKLGRMAGAATTSATAVERQRLRVAELQLQLQELKQKQDATTSAVDRTTAAIQKSSGEIGRSVGVWSAIGTAVGGVATQLAGMAVGAVKDVASAMIDGNAEFEKYTVQFGVLLGGAENAQKRLKELAEFGAATPFDLPEIVRADKVLQSFGLHAEDAAKRFGMSGTQMRTVAGDVAAGTGASFEDIARYIGQFSAGQTGMVLSRFEELGIVTRKELGAMGLEFAKSGELVTPVDDAMDVLLVAMQGKFGGMMDAQSKTFGGMMSNMRDWVGNAMRTLGAPIFDVVKENLGGLLTLLSSPQAKQAMSDLASGLANGVSQIIQFGGQAVAWVQANWPQISAVFNTVGAAIQVVVDTVVRPLLEGLLGVVGRVVGFVQENWPLIQKTIETSLSQLQTFWNTFWPPLQPVVEGIFNSIKAVIDTVLTAIFGIVKAAMQLFTGDWESAWNTLKSTAQGIWDGIVKFFEGVPKVLLDIGRQMIQGLVDGIKANGNAVIEALKGLIDQAIGGIKAVLHMSSPSRVMMDIGANMATGLAIGYARALRPLPVPGMAGSGMLNGRSVGRRDTFEGGRATSTVQIFLGEREVGEVMVDWLARRIYQDRLRYAS